MKLLPIEEGCRAVIINDDKFGFAGRECIVGEFIGDICNFPSRFGDINGKSFWRIIGDFNPVISPICKEQDLVRIDGNEDLFKSEEDNKVLEISNDN